MMLQSIVVHYLVFFKVMYDKGRMFCVSYFIPTVYEKVIITLYSIPLNFLLLCRKEEMFFIIPCCFSCCVGKRATRTFSPKFFTKIVNHPRVFFVQNTERGSLPPGPSLCTKTDPHILHFDHDKKWEKYLHFSVNLYKNYNSYYLSRN